LDGPRKTTFVQPRSPSPGARRENSYSPAGTQNRKRRRLAGAGEEQVEEGEGVLPQGVGAVPLGGGNDDRGPSSSNRTSTHNGAPLLPGSR